MSHDHAHSSHDPTSMRRLAIAFGLAATYMGVEAVGGYLSGSLALLADAGHMLSDASALAIALLAAWVASRPSGARWTYGRRRAEVLAALVQAVGLFVVASVIVIEAAERLRAPQPVHGLGVLGIGTGGLVVNLLALWVLAGGRQGNLNVRAAWLHVASDTLGSLGVIVAGAGVWLFGWLWLDPAISLGIATLVAFSAWRLLRETVDVLMEAAPPGVEVELVHEALDAVGPVREVHDLHVWTTGASQAALSCHLVVEEDGQCASLLSEIRSMLVARFGIHHVTVQIEPVDFAESALGDACRDHCAPAAGSAETAS